MKAIFSDGNLENLGVYGGGYSSLNSIAPDGSGPDTYYNVHIWMAIPTSRSGLLRIIPHTASVSGVWISGIAFG